MRTDIGKAFYFALKDAEDPTVVLVPIEWWKAHHQALDAWTGEALAMLQNNTGLHCLGPSEFEHSAILGQDLRPVLLMLGFQESAAFTRFVLGR